MTKGTRNARGFTLVELAIAVVIIGVLAAFGVPRYLSAVERSKASEAYNYLAVVNGAQERYTARQGTYADKLSSLDINVDVPGYFKVGDFKVPASAKSFETGWELTLTREGTASGYGKYTVVFTQAGFDSKKSTIPADINPMRN